MNILVIGGTRFIGKHLVNQLLLHGNSVTIATRGLTKDSYGDKVNRICFDRTEEQNIREALADLHFDIVYDSLAFCSNDIKGLLEHVKCKRYIEISSASVYNAWHNDTKEEEFDANKKQLILCAKDEVSYNEAKQQAECAIVQLYSHIPSVRVRFPFVIGEDDYTKRLYFYVEHIIRQIPMHIDNYENQMSFVQSSEAGKFLAFLADKDFCGSINGANRGTISIKQVAKYVKQKTGKTIIISDMGEKAPYNGADEYGINIDKAKRIGFSFTALDTWIYELLDRYISRCKSIAK